jgi:hypothetical protein
MSNYKNSQELKMILPPNCVVSQDGEAGVLFGYLGEECIFELKMSGRWMWRTVDATCGVQYFDEESTVVLIEKEAIKE